MVENEAWATTIVASKLEGSNLVIEISMADARKLLNDH